MCLRCGEMVRVDCVCECRLNTERLAGQAPISIGHHDESDFFVMPGYGELASVLQAALNQAQSGKGKERHATDKPFTQQPIMQIRRMVGSGYTLGQAMKKAQESQRLPADQAEVDLLGAINYLAAEVLARREES